MARSCQKDSSALSLSRFCFFASAASLYSICCVLDGIEWDDLVFFDRLGAYAEFGIQWIIILQR